MPIHPWVLAGDADKIAYWLEQHYEEFAQVPHAAQLLGRLLTSMPGYDRTQADTAQVCGIDLHIPPPVSLPGRPLRSTP